MNGARAGVEVERKVRDDLTAHGYVVYRSAGSRGAADLVAIGVGEVLFIQCKRSKPQLPPAERRALVWLADRLGAEGLPIVATRPPRQGISYRVLTGVGPKDHMPFEPTHLDVSAYEAEAS